MGANALSAEAAAGAAGAWGVCSLMAFLPKRKKDDWVARHTAQMRWTDKGLPRLGHLPPPDNPPQQSRNGDTLVPGLEWRLGTDYTRLHSSGQAVDDMHNSWALCVQRLLNSHSSLR